jgi:hypothetical protein
MKRICLALAFALALPTAPTAQTRAENEQQGCELLWPAAACEKVIPWAKSNGLDVCITETLKNINPPSTRKMPGMNWAVLKTCSMMIDGFSEEQTDAIITRTCAKLHDPRSVSDCRGAGYLKD